MEPLNDKLNSDRMDSLASLLAIVADCQIGRSGGAIPADLAGEQSFEKVPQVCGRMAFTCRIHHKQGETMTSTSYIGHGVKSVRIEPNSCGNGVEIHIDGGWTAKGGYSLTLFSDDGTVDGIKVTSSHPVHVFEE